MLRNLRSKFNLEKILPHTIYKKMQPNAFLIWQQNIYDCKKRGVTSAHGQRRRVHISLDEGQVGAQESAPTARMCWNTTERGNDCVGCALGRATALGLGVTSCSIENVGIAPFFLVVYLESYAIRSERIL
jgi:hypothetical protein